MKYRQVGHPREGWSIWTRAVMDSHPGLDVMLVDGKVLEVLEMSEFTTPAVLFTKFCTFVVDTPILLARRFS